MVPGRRIVVVGGGISGLAAAWQLAEREPSADITVLEAAAAIGGKLRLAEVAGLQVDVGAEALLARRPEGVALVRGAGLGDDLITPLTLSARVRAGGENRPLPARTLLGVPGDVGALRASGVLTDTALARVANESSESPLAPLVDDVAVGALVRSRLGEEVVARLVEPLLAGVYAGRADALSLAATMPALAAALRKGGSLVAAAHGVTSAATGAGPVFVSLRGGLARLPIELARSSRFTVRTDTTVRAVRRTDTGFALDCGAVPDSVEVTADAVVIATPAAKTALLLRALAPLAAAELAAVETASVAIITMAFAGLELPAASGLLVGAGERFAVKAVTLSSQKWPGTPPGYSVLRASVGRAGQVEDLQRDDGELIALVRRELAALLGICAAPVDALVTRWGGGLPQYAVGHLERVSRIRTAVAAVPGLAICGASYEGIGIPACVASAARAVDSITAAPAATRVSG